MKDKYVVVIGAANIDIGGTPYNKLIANDSNPGRISVSYGGVGRNIAHNLSLLGVSVRLITAVGDDDLSRVLVDHCTRSGIDMSCTLEVPGHSSSMYMYINDDDGDMALALSYVDIAYKITPEYIDSVSYIINNAELVVADCNLSHDTLMRIMEICRVPLCVDPVSQPHASKIKGHLEGIDILKPNRYEAEYLTDMVIESEEDYIAAADELLSQGVGRVFISMSDRGILAADADHKYISDIFPAEIMSTTGAGDSATAAIVWALTRSSDNDSSVQSAEDTAACHNYPASDDNIDNDLLVMAADAANAAASVTVSSVSTISPDMSEERIISMMMQRRSIH